MPVLPPDPADYQRLLQQERRLNHVAQAVDLGMWFCDLPFDELHWNDAVRDHFWVPPHVRVTIDLFYERIHPEDRNHVRAAIDASIAAHTLYDTQMRSWNPANISDCKWVRAIGWTSYNDAGSPTRFDGITFDITQERQRTQAIAQRDQYFRALIDSSPAIFFMTDATGRCIYISKSWYTYTGGNSAQELSLQWLEALHPQDRGPTAAQLQTAIQQRGSFQAEYRVCRHDGDYRWVTATAMPRFETDETFAGLIGTMIDIHDRKATEASLQRSETRLTLAMQAAKMGFWEWQIDSDAIMLSDQLCQDWGIDLATFGGRLTDAVARIHPEDRDLVEVAIRQNLASGNPYDIEYRVLRPDGTVIWIHANGRTVREKNGRTVRAVGTSMNITASKRQAELLLDRERQFRTLADSMPVLVWISDAHVNVTYINERWRNFFGGPVGYNWDWAELLHPDDVESTVQGVRAGQAAGVPFALEHRLRAATGAYVWHLTRGVPIADGQGLVYQWFGTCTDIQVQREAAASLQQAVHLRDEFLSIASHELKTPLSSLILQTQMWRRRLIKEDARAQDPQRLLQTAEQNAGQLARLNRLVDDMLDVARIRSGRLSMERAPMDLAVLVQECVERMRPQFPSEHLLYQGETSVLGTWDRVRLDQVLTNLLSNALRYGRGAPVQVRLLRLTDRLELSVQDHGSGIEPGARERIFNRF